MNKMVRQDKKSTLRKHPRPLPPLPLTEEELHALYEELNQTRFGDRLPKAIVEWNDPPAGLVASTHPFSALGPSIWISPLWASLEGKEWVRRILLHEMCHVQEPRGPEDNEHGPRWRAAMMHLYAQGERWVLGDLAKMAEKEAEEVRLLGPMFTEMARLDPRLSWEIVSEVLLKKFGRRRGRKFGLSAAALIEQSPRLPQFWFNHAESRRLGR